MSPAKRMMEEVHIKNDWCGKQWLGHEGRQGRHVDIGTRKRDFSPLVNSALWEAGSIQS